MFKTSSKDTSSEIKDLVQNTQSLFQAAAKLSGEKADEMRSRGMALLDSALAQSQAVQAATLEAGEEAAACASRYVKANPWRSLAAVAGAGLLIGMVVRRK
jgi:ElaB/YqjD/DUF883 family membrane-anchored ribosome-binding protein